MKKSDSHNANIVHEKIRQSQESRLPENIIRETKD
jgi:hypothetical protein